LLDEATRQQYDQIVTESTSKFLQRSERRCPAPRLKVRYRGLGAARTAGELALGQPCSDAQPTDLLTHAKHILVGGIAVLSGSAYNDATAPLIANHASDGMPVTN
jgi:hypothetical protein